MWHRGVLLVALLAAATSCAARAVWLNGHPPLLDTYSGPDITVRIYRAGQECRIEVVGLKESVITLPTRCVTVPHIARP